MCGPKKLAVTPSAVHIMTEADGVSAAIRQWPGCFPYGPFQVYHLLRSSSVRSAGSVFSMPSFRSRFSMTGAKLIFPALSAGQSRRNRAASDCDQRGGAVSAASAADERL